MLVTVIYPSDGSPEKSRIETVLDIPTSDVQFALNRAWRLMNVVSESDVPRFRIYAEWAGVSGMRSSMVGDVYITDSGLEKKYFICDMIGFSEVSEEIAKKWESLDNRDRTMGYKYVSSIKSFI